MDDTTAVPPEPPTTAAPGATSPGTRSDIFFGYEGDGGQYLLIGLVNALLGVLTLGFYYAWGRVRELRFLIGSVRADRDTFSFHGNGRELFWGVMRAWLLFGVPFAAVLIGMNWSSTHGDANQGVWVILFYALLLVFVPFALIGSLRYRASRTSWRGIRFGFDGRFSAFAPEYMVRLLLVAMTLGLAYPFVASWRRDYVLSHSSFGSESFGYDGQGGDLFPRYLLCWFLIVPTFGLSLVWFHGFQQAYFWNHTTLGSARFKSTLTGMDWLGMSMLNSLLATITLGIAAPWIYVRIHRLFFDRLSLAGADLAAIHARASQGSALGEGMADVMNVDGGVDIGLS